jgi:hypothetical protein
MIVLLVWGYYEYTQVYGRVVKSLLRDYENSVKDTVPIFLIQSRYLTRKKFRTQSFLMLPIALTRILLKTGSFHSPGRPQGSFSNFDDRENKTPLPEGLASLRSGIHSRSP